MLRWLLRILVGRPEPKTLCRYWYEVQNDGARVAVGFQTFEEMLDWVASDGPKEAGAANVAALNGVAVG